MNDRLRCLVLGGKGFIGSHLVDALVATGHGVRCFDRPNVADISNEIARHPSIEYVEGDFASEADVAAAVQGCNVCFHLVSTTLPHSSNLDPIFDVETNLLGTVRLLNHGLKAGVTKIIFVSSGGTVYGVPRTVPIDENHPTEPICSYGITKLAIEKYLHLYSHLHGIRYVVVRPSNPYGERQRTQATQGAVAVFLGKTLRGETIEVWGDGSVVRDYIHISDVVSALVRAIAYEGTERVFNIGSGLGIDLNGLLDTIEQVTGLKTKRKYTEARKMDVPISVLAIDRARKHLEWSPQQNLLGGLVRTVEWLRSSQTW